VPEEALDVENIDECRAVVWLGDGATWSNGWPIRRTRDSHSIEHAVEHAMDCGKSCGERARRHVMRTRMKRAGQHWLRYARLAGARELVASSSTYVSAPAGDAVVHVEQHRRRG
jgi:hypothetical protein